MGTGRRQTMAGPVDEGGSAPRLAPGTRLILASGSPRRLDILRRYGLDPEVEPPDIDESLPPGLGLDGLPAALAALAEAKATSVRDRLAAAGRLDPSEPALLIAADTVVFAGRVLGKPPSPAAAVEMLMSLAGRRHQVLTALAVLRWPDGARLGRVERAEVRFRDYSQAQAEAYVKAEPPLDKAGAYAIQGSWSSQVSELDGDIETVIGLPFRSLADMLDALTW